MKKLQTTVFLLLFSLTSFGQQVNVKTMLLPKSFRNITLDDTDSVIKFPVIKTGNFEIDSAINTDLKKRFTKTESKNLSTDSILIDWATERMFGLEYEVTSTKNGYFSFNITTHIKLDLSAHIISTYTDYYNYDLKTGKYVEFNEIIDISNDFREQLNSDKLKQFEIQKKELEKEFQLHLEIYEQQEIITHHNTNVPPFYYPDYEGMWRKSELEDYSKCKNYLDNISFALHSDTIEMIFKCCDSNDRDVFNQNPVIKLKYNYEDIREYLKVKL
jgi:hypothetical protein